jgi:hypothetical protein
MREMDTKVHLTLVNLSLSIKYEKLQLKRENDFGCFASNTLLLRLQTITLLLPYKFKEQVYSQ